MNQLLKTLIFIFACLLGSAHALPLPKAGAFNIKTIPDQNMLYVVHYDDEHGHISNSLVKLVRFYLLEASDDYQVVFPHTSIESNALDGTYYAVGYEGAPKPLATDAVQTTVLEGGTFASFIYQGNYRDIGSAIRDTLQKLLKTGEYIPHEDEEIRLLYWNSIDDNHPEDLITEIQVRAVTLP